MSRFRPDLSERGGAYLLALTALLALTGLGIALSRIGATERRLGAAVASREHALAAAESGLAIAVAGLLEGRLPEHAVIELAQRPLGWVTSLSRVAISPPSLQSVVPCDACDDDTGTAKVSYRLATTGERLARAGPGAGAGERGLARVDLEAVVTLQPWPVPGSPDGDSGAEGPDPQCADDEVIARLAALLTAELNPPRCRLAGRELPVRAIDPESAAVCAVDVPVCVLLSEWRELGPS